MGRYETQGDIEISADALWKTIRNFGDVSWLPGKPKATWEGEGPGMVRVVDTKPFPLIREQLDAIDEQARAVHYRVIDGNPFPVRDYKACMQVVDLGDGRSRLLWSSTWQPVGVSEADAGKAIGVMYKGVLGFMKKSLVGR